MAGIHICLIPVRRIRTESDLNNFGPFFQLEKSALIHDCLRRFFELVDSCRLFVSFFLTYEYIYMHTLVYSDPH